LCGAKGGWTSRQNCSHVSGAPLLLPLVRAGGRVRHHVALPAPSTQNTHSYPVHTRQHTNITPHQAPEVQNRTEQIVDQGRLPRGHAAQPRGAHSMCLLTHTSTPWQPASNFSGGCRRPSASSRLPGSKQPQPPPAQQYSMAAGWRLGLCTTKHPPVEGRVAPGYCKQQHTRAPSQPHPAQPTQKQRDPPHNTALGSSAHLNKRPQPHPDHCQQPVLRGNKQGCSAGRHVDWESRSSSSNQCPSCAA
jgi:hypothetical protein